MQLENSETLRRLVNAFAGESQSRNRYTFFAKQAKKEGYEQISAVFLETADNEHEHAKIFYKLIPISEHREVTGAYPFFFGSTYDNLISSSLSEREEWEVLYKEGAEIAKAEGFEEAQKAFSGILEIEKRHSHRFQTLANELLQQTLFIKSEENQWICRKCGHTQISKSAPNICPVCGHPQGYFQLFAEKF
jgi:rubrerythrin